MARSTDQADLRRDVLVTGATGYIGTPLCEALVARGHRVRALVRAPSLGRVVRGVTAVEGDALSAASVAQALKPGDTLVHLVGTPHPNPSKAAEFKRVDLVSIEAAVDAARRVSVAHVVYVSVAQPAPVMKAYIAARAAGERAIRSAGLTATVLRPWYVLGPGHRWPVVLLPLYAIAALIPGLRERAQLFNFVTLRQMVEALVHAVEHPAARGEMSIVEVPQIRRVRSRLLQMPPAKL